VLTEYWTTTGKLESIAPFFRIKLIRTMMEKLLVDGSIEFELKKSISSFEYNELRNILIEL
jgi:hypothetical protein